MAYREKLAWIVLVTTVVVYGAYFALEGPRLMAPGAAPLAFLGPLTGSIIVFVILQIVLAAGAAATDPAGARALMDERDRQIALSANRAGFYVLQVGAFAAIVTLFWRADAALMANAVFGAMVTAEAARALVQVVAYRRGAA
jgi:hypothetical protein